MRSKDTSSDTLQNAKRSGSHQAESDKRLSKIQHACQETAPDDRRKRTLGENLHVFESGTKPQLAFIRLGGKAAAIIV